MHLSITRNTSQKFFKFLHTEAPWISYNNVNLIFDTKYHEFYSLKGSTHDGLFTSPGFNTNTGSWEYSFKSILVMPYIWKKQSGAELDQAQVKLEAIVEVVVEANNCLIHFDKRDSYDVMADDV